MADPTAALESAIYAKLATDATLAALLPGVERLVTVSDATGGTFTLTYGGKETAAIAYNATAATVKTRLAALSSVGAGKVTVSGDAGGPWTVTFAPGMVGALTADTALLEGAGAALSIAQRASVHNTIAPADTAYPYAVFQMVGGPPPHNALGQRAYWECLYQVRVIDEGPSRATILQALARIDALLERASLTVTGAAVKGILRDAPLPAMSEVEAGTVYQQVGAQWRFWVQET